jgi:peptide/nickel transport system permease protein
MTAFIIRRLIQAAGVALLMSLLVFTGVFMIGDPVEMLVADDADEADREMVKSNLGLDRPYRLASSTVQ